MVFGTVSQLGLKNSQLLGNVYLSGMGIEF